MNNFGKNALAWLLIIVMMVTVFNMFQGPQGSDGDREIMYSEFIQYVDGNAISEIIIEGDELTGKHRDGWSFRTVLPNDPDLVKRLSEKGIPFKATNEDGGLLFNIFVGWFPMLLLIAVWIYFMRQAQGGGGKGGAMGFGKSRARLLTEHQGRVMFEDVAGIEEAKEELEEIVEFLREPNKFQRLGGKIPKGALLVGSPGTGKTLLAKAVAGEANVPFFTISGSDFVEMFVGVGASRVRDMFEQAKKNAPCIIFIDEIDAVGRHRGAGLGGGNDEREQTLNQLLVEMDGFESNEGIILLAATNRPDVLDPALLRPGRFDRQVVVPLPDIVGREKILNVHMRKVPLAPDVNSHVIARGTPGFSGADLANLVNEAALLAARKNKRLVSMSEFEHAKDKVMMGTERRSMVMTEEEKKMTAYHEAGHALMSVHSTHLDPIHKATIIPRGRALGMVLSLPERDEYSFRRQKMYDNLAMTMGGRVAEELVFGYKEVSSGASGDIAAATNLARKMVTQWGMSEKLGPIQYAANEQEVFLGHSVSQQKNISEETARLIDEEIKRLVCDGYDRAKKTLTKHRDQLNILGEALLEYETLTGDDIKDILAGKDISEKNAPKDDTTTKTNNGAGGTVPDAGTIAEDGGDAEPQPEG